MLVCYHYSILKQAKEVRNGHGITAEFKAGERKAFFTP